MESKSAQTRSQILHCAMDLIREQGYAATGIDQICRKAGVTKGAFFHYFKGKEEMAIAAAQYFADMADQLFAAAPYQQIADPAEKVLSYIDFRAYILQGETHEYTCLLGTLAQEIHSSHPAIRDACQEHIWNHSQTLVPAIQSALDKSNARDQNAESLALYTQAVLQGAFILAKASHSPDTAREIVTHLRRYFETIFYPQGEHL